MKEFTKTKLKTAKKTYATPKLTRYGKVTELTAGATGNAAESSMGGSRRP